MPKCINRSIVVMPLCCSDNALRLERLKKMIGNFDIIIKIKF